jgi:hypothetical protein
MSNPRETPNSIEESRGNQVGRIPGSVEASQKYQLEAVNARVVLVLGKPIPAKLLWARNLFGTEVVEDVRVPASFQADLASAK